MVPEGWEITPLGVAAKVVDCKHRTPVYADAGYPIVSPGNIRWGELDLKSCRRVEAKELESMMDHCTVEVGDIVMGRNQSVGIGAYVGADANFALGQDTILIQPKKVNPRYLYEFTASVGFQRQIYRLLGGSTFARINLGDIRKLDIISPTLPEQRKIADILSTWDRAIETTEALLATARTQKRALMQSLLTGKRRFPEFEGQDWKEVRLGELADVITKGTTPTSVGFEFTSSGVNFIKAENIDNTGSVLLTKSFISPECHSALGRSQFAEGDTLVTIAGAIGRVATVLGSVLPANTNQAVALIRVAPTAIVRQSFLAYWLQGKEIQNVFRRSVTTGAQPNISLGQLSKLSIRYPSKDEQDRITAALDFVSREVEVSTAQIEKLRTEKKALMQQLLTGKRRVVV